MYQRRYFGEILLLATPADVKMGERELVGNFSTPLVYIFTSFLATKARDLISRGPCHKTLVTQLILSSENHHPTFYLCEDSSVISVQCFSNYRVLMNQLGTWLKCRFGFNRSGVEPNTRVSNKLQWTLMLHICKPHLSSRVLVSLPSQIWSTFYLKVSLWLVIYQENYTGQKTQTSSLGEFYPVHRCSLTFTAQTVDLSSCPEMPFPSCLAE